MHSNLNVCVWVCVCTDIQMYMCLYLKPQGSESGFALRMTLVEAFSSLCLVPVFMHYHTRLCLNICPYLHVWDACALICFLIFNVESDHKCVHRLPHLSAPISLPFCPSLHRFTQRHQGLASWCLHCKSGLTIRRWLDPTHIQKHPIYLFRFLSCRPSGCIISDQGDISTSKFYSLVLQVNLLPDKLKQSRHNKILMAWCWAGSHQLFEVLQTGTFGTCFWI